MMTSATRRQALRLGAGAAAAAGASPIQSSGVASSLHGGAGTTPPVTLSVFEGQGRHACLALDDAERFSSHVASWMQSAALA